MMISNTCSDPIPYSYNFMFNQNSNFYDYQIPRPISDLSTAMTSSSSNPDSPDSTLSMPPSPAMSVTLSPQSMENLLSMSSEEHAQNNIDLMNPQPFLVICEQPVDKYRFRYKSEMMGSHGCMLGQSSDKRKKYFPSVELVGYNGPAVIRCSLYTAHMDESRRTFHCHRLVTKVGKEDRDDPHQISVDSTTTFVAVFRGMGIIHTAKKNIAEELIRKKRVRLLEMNKARNINVSQLSQNDEVKVRAEAEAEARAMDLNVVTLCFEAFKYDANNILVPICRPAFSHPIRNMKSALTGELKICRIDRHFSTCVGGDEVWMLVEKVGRKNIKVKFYELDDDDNEIWYDFGKFTELDVHHQYAIVFRTPPYRRMDLDEPKDVLIQLFRPTDGGCSEPIKFTYRPSDKFLDGSRKRARSSSSSCDVPIPLTRRECDVPVPLPPITRENGFDFVPPGPMLSSAAAGGEVDFLRDLETMSVSSTTIEQVLFNEDILDSAEFREFMEHESFGAYLNTYDAIPNDMDLSTDSGSSRRRPKGVLRPQPPYPGLQINAAPTPAPTPAPATTPLSGDVLLKAVVRRLMKLIAADPAPNSSAVAVGIRDMFEKKAHDGDCALHVAVKPENKVYFDRIMSIIIHSRAIQSETLQLYISDILNSRNKKLETPLNRAVFYNQPATVATLLKGGANPNISDVNGFTPLHVAVVNAHNACLKELLYNANYTRSPARLYLNIKSEDGFSPLHMAARGGNAEAVRLLVTAGADINERDHGNGRTPLHIAVEEENAEIVRYLVSRPGIRVNEPDYAGNTPLHVACVVGGVGSLEMCTILVDAKANPSLPNFNTEAAEEDESGTQQEDTVVKVEPDVEHDYFEQPKGQTSFDLASDNKEIMDLLQVSGSPGITIKQEPSDDTPPVLPKEEPTANAEFFDNETMAKLCKILNENGGWRQLGELLDYNSVIVSFSFHSSPTRALLNYADIHGTASVEQIRECLHLLDETAAVKVIDEMLARRLAETFT